MGSWSTTREGAATASDAAGHATTATIQVVVDNGTADTTPPVVAITSPGVGAVISGTTRVAMTATDNVGVTRVQLFIDGVLRATFAAAPFAFDLDTRTLANGSHLLRAVAVDAAATPRALRSR